ncbi:MAG: epoxyqueuosine reductase QueH [Candidatus Woesearchaeota archaeon]
MREKLLLHTCCAPCLLAAFHHLKNNYEITAFYFNPNIYPKEEYDKRKENAKLACEKERINLVEGEYTHQEWLSFVSKAPKFQSQPEGGARCLLCFEERLRRTAEYAKNHGFKAISTTLTSGSNKKAEIINRIGEEVASQFGLTFVSGDFKKGGGFEYSVRECKSSGIYRQNYCGCEFSIRKC